MEHQNTQNMETIHDKFVLSVQCMDSRYKVFEVIQHWIQHLRDEVESNLIRADDLTMARKNEIQTFLEMEQDTWSLILTLYFSRLEEKEDMSMAVDNAEIDPLDEKTSVAQITENNPAVKEVSLILRWLESIAARQPEPALFEKFVNWEQTLETLKRDNKVGSKIGNPMITSMDPDACFREGKEVHPFDSEEDAKVLKGAFTYVRAGQVQKAIDYLFESGHMATAAMLNGYEYSEKIQYNLESDTGFGVLGNPERDMWKCTAFEVCEENGLSKYGRAALGALCGNRKALLDVAASWEDKLWAFMRVMYDVRVEGELRRLSGAELLPLPDEYWAQDISIAECTNQVESSDTDFGTNIHHVFQLVQKHVIIDDIKGLLTKLKLGLVHQLEVEEYSATRGHLVRFLTHLLLAFGIVGLTFEEDLMNISTEAYIKVLVLEGKLECIPFYVEKLSAEKQIPVIVDQIRPDVASERTVIDVFMQAAHINNLDLLGTANAIVAKLCDTQDNFDVGNLFWITSCYSLVPDSRNVMLSFLRNSITITRKYLVLNNLPKCNLLIRQINDNCTNEVLSLSEDYQDTLIREFHCYKIYLEAEDSFLLWQRSLTQQLRIENVDLDASLLDSSSNIGERTLQEKKRMDLKVAEEKWKKTINHHLKNCLEKFFAVLKYPGGWLVDCVTPTNEEEFNSVKAVRRIILPKVVFILIRLLTEQNPPVDLRKFVYILCEDSHEILKEFTTSEISSIFKAIEKFTRSGSTTLNQLPK